MYVHIDMLHVKKKFKLQLFPYFSIIVNLISKCSKTHLKENHAVIYNNLKLVS